MKLPMKSRYTVPEAAFHIAISTGESIRSDHILDWGAQGLFKLYLSMTHVQVRQGTEVLSLHQVQVEIRPTVDEAAQLARGGRIKISTCWHNGQEGKFVRRKNAEYGGGYVLDSLYFDAKSIVLRGDELSTFISSIRDSAQAVTQAAQKSAASLFVEQQEKTWREKVREIADKLDARDAEAGAESSKGDMADRVAKIAEQDGIRGPHGKLTAGNILREALQGRKWTRAARIPKATKVEDNGGEFGESGKS